MAAQEEEDRVEGIAADRADLFLGYLGKRERRTSLEVDIVGEGESREGGEGGAGEEVGCRAV
jgi:hypothetical protein